MKLFWIALLLLVPVLALVACEQLGRHPLAGEVAAALASLDPPIGVVEQSRNQLSIGDGSLRLSVSERGEDANTVHVHIAEVKGNFDACIVGGGANRAQRTAQVAKIFRDIAFPVLWSHLHAEALLGARLFTGSEPWGVPGFRGFAGPLMVRGRDQDTSDLDNEALFGGLAAPPPDGRAHYFKATLWPDRDGWRRAVELDGDLKLIDGEPWKSSVKSRGRVLVEFAVVEALDAETDRDARASAMQRLAERPTWLTAGAANCPADILPSRFSSGGVVSGACSGGRLRDCVHECEQGASQSCYNAALEGQAHRFDETVVSALFVRACRLGNASACTNSAAGRGRVADALDRCSIETFRKVCEMGADPWACTMTAGELAKNIQTAEDEAKVRDLVDAGCRYGPSDPACQTATGLLEGLGQQRRSPTGPRSDPRRPGAR